jgi:hypothetical protein
VSKLSKRIQRNNDAANKYELSNTDARIARFGLQSITNEEPIMGAKIKKNINYFY